MVLSTIRCQSRTLRSTFVEFCCTNLYFSRVSKGVFSGYFMEHPCLQYVYVGTHDDVYYQTQLSFCIFMIEDPYNKTENALNER